MTIDTILFDADGVLQRPTVWWKEAFAPILGTTDPARLESSLQEVLDAESSALCTPSDFDDALRQVLIKWYRGDHLAEIVRAMNAIDVYEDVMGAVQSLQRVGVTCHMASNQQAGRARHMSETLNYRKLFTREFYSCSLGVAKPEVAFFEQVLHALDLQGSKVLFLDDRQENVEAAQRTGIAAAVYAGDSGPQVLRKILGEHGLTVT